MKKDLSIPERIIRAVFFRLGEVAILLALISFAGNRFDQEFARIPEVRDSQFGRILVVMLVSLIAGVFLIIASAFLGRASWVGLPALISGNSLLLYWNWQDRKGAVLIPLALGLGCLIYEEAKLVRPLEKQRA
jgi:hypothetical protein